VFFAELASGETSTTVSQEASTLDDHVIKLIPDVYSREFEAETRALSLLEKHMSAMPPRF